MNQSLKTKIKPILFAAALIVLAVVVQAVVGMLGGFAISFGAVLQGKTVDVQSLTPVFLFLAEIACILVFGIWYFVKYVKRDKNEGVYESGLKKILNIKDLAFITTLAIAGFFLANIIAGVVSAVIPGSGESFESLMDSIYGEGNVLGTIATVLLAPIAEEIVFRGLLVKNAKKVFGLTGCMVLSGIAFGIYHFQPVQSIYAIPLGMILAYLAYKYNSIIPAILAHAINNSIAVFLPKIYHGDMGYITCTVLCLAFLAVSFVIKKCFFKKELAIS